MRFFVFIVFCGKEKAIMENKEILSVSELSEYLGLGLSKTYELCHSIGFPIVKLGRKILIPRKQLEEWIEKQLKC